MASLIQQWQRRPNWQRFFFGVGPQAAPHITVQRNVYILPTRAGVFFAFVLLVMLLGAINYTNSLGYMFTFLLSSFAVVAILHSYRNILRLSIRTQAVAPVFCGEATELFVMLENPTPTTRFALESGWPKQTDPLLSDLPPGQTRLSLTLPTTQRGLHPLPRFVVASCFPVGLFRAWTHVHLKQDYLVYPKPARYVPAPPPSLYSQSQLGDQGRGSDDFVGLRDYNNGDSLRHVHWKAMARQQRMLTKQFGGDRSDELWLDWSTLEGTALELRLSILCRWVIDAAREAKQYGLRLPGETIAPAFGPAHRHRCLRALAVYAQEPTSAL